MNALRYKLAALKNELAAAKRDYSALRAPNQMPLSGQYTKAKDFIGKFGATMKPHGDGDNPKRKIYNQVIADHDAVIAYRAEKTKLDKAVAAKQRELAAVQLELAAAASVPPSDLE